MCGARDVPLGMDQMPQHRISALFDPAVAVMRSLLLRHRHPRRTGRARGQPRAALPNGFFLIHVNISFAERADAERCRE